MEESGQLHAPVALPPGKEPLGTLWKGGWVGPRVGLDVVEKKKSCTAGNRIRVVQPAVRRCADWVIPAPRVLLLLLLLLLLQLWSGPGVLCDRIITGPFRPKTVLQEPITRRQQPDYFLDAATAVRALHLLERRISRTCVINSGPLR
jgi:hypothetical protein